MSVPCPFCGAHAETRETRTTKAGTVTRAKVCMNGHRFSTQEAVFAPRFGRLRSADTVQKPKRMLTQVNRRNAVRDALLAKDGRPLAQIALDCDASLRTVNRIKATLIKQGVL